MQEIERKFLVTNDDYKLEAERVHHIIQGYLSRDPSRTVRIRILDDKAYINIKGPSDSTGISRFEWEKEISVDDACQLIQLALPGTIEKVRYIVPINNELKWEVDEFLGENEGLVLAEIDLPDPNTSFQKPNWLGKEVTGKPEYYNAHISKQNF